MTSDRLCIQSAEKCRLAEDIEKFPTTFAERRVLMWCAWSMEMTLYDETARRRDDGRHRQGVSLYFVLTLSIALRDSAA